jgi:hypothetical protein
MPDMVKGISQIFADQVFYVPDYQRGYAWDQRQWDDLLEDLELLPEGRSHFTGTLVMRAHNDQNGKILDQDMHAYKPLDIIDGQQRLTTVVILLKAIHDEMLSFPKLSGITQSLRGRYLHHINLNGQPFTKLTLNADSQDFFARNILALQPSISGPTIRSHQRLLGAFEHFSAYLKHKREELGDDYSTWLRSYYAKITLNLNLIIYQVADELDAGTIFETMNDRGKPITEMEKVKNYLLYVSGKLDLPEIHDLNRRINITWKYLYERLMAAGLVGREYEDQLLRAHWLMAYDYNVTSWENARSIKKRFSLRSYQDKHAQLLQELKEYLSTLEDAVTAYTDIFSPGHEKAFNNIKDPELRKAIVLWSKKLTRLGVSASFLPLLIAVRTRAGDDSHAYLQTVERLEKYAFRVFAWRRARSNAGQTTLFRLGNEFFQRQNIQQTLVEVSRTLLWYCPDETFEERFNRETENWYSWHDINYFLYEYEHYLAGGRPVQLTWEALNARPKTSSIEHILPQAVRARYWTGRFNKQQRERWTHDLGNLTLTYDNSSLGIRPFPDKKGQSGKKGTYADSPLFIERQLASYEDWTPAQIQQRREQMREWSLKRWHIEPPPILQNKYSQDAEQRLLQLAEEKGNLAEFKSLLKAARELPVYTRMQRNWYGFTLTPPVSKTTTLIWIDPDLTIWIGHRAIDQQLGIPVEKVKEIFGDEQTIKLKPEEVAEFIAKLNEFFEEMRPVGAGQ